MRASDQRLFLATWKDLQGRLLVANLEYERVTRKSRGDALGHFSSENWPGHTGKLIAYHDNVVHSTRKCYLTKDPLGFGTRMTMRFPILVESDLNATATLGFHEHLLHLCSGVAPNQRRVWRFALDLAEAQEIGRAVSHASAV